MGDWIISKWGNVVTILIILVGCSWMVWLIWHH